MISSAYYYDQTDFLIYTTIYIHIWFQSSHLFYLLFCSFKKEPGRLAKFSLLLDKCSPEGCGLKGRAASRQKRRTAPLTAGHRGGTKGRLRCARLAASVTGEIFLVVRNRHPNVSEIV